MRRRDLLTLLGVAATVRPLVARPQPPRRIGYLRFAPADAKQLADLLGGLEETGYAEGRNLLIEYRYADGDYRRLPDLARDLVRRNIEVVITSGGPDTARAAMQATTDIPIVGTSVSPLVKHFNHPEGNVTGVNIVTGDLTPKRLQILTELVPAAAIGVLMNPNYGAYHRDREQIEDVGRQLSVRLAFATVSADADIEVAVASLAGRHVGGLLPEAEPFSGNRWQQLIQLATRYAIPMMHEWREAVVAGGLISYAPSLRWINHQVGLYTGQILNGAKPADLPVVSPAQLELVINLKTAKALGLIVPQPLLARADEVIE
jgi:putative ABC transport system substrate-binding protein